MKIREVYPEDHWSWEFLTLPHSCMRGALGTTAGQRWGSREPPTFRVFSVSWIRGSAPRKPFRSVSCKGIPAKGQHWLSLELPQPGEATLYPRTSAVLPQVPRMSAVSLSTGVPSREGPAVVGAWRTSGQ